MKFQNIIFILLLILAQSSYAQSSDYKFSTDIENDTNQRYGYQMKAWELSRINKHQKSLLLWDKNRISNVLILQKDSILFSTLKPLNANKYISSKADSFQVIMLNEAHHNNFHRQFTLNLLKDLYGKGFRYIGF